MNNITEPAINNVKEIFTKRLAIPDYQRPYKWRTRHIRQLFDDIHAYFCADKTAECRLGTVVLNRNDDKIDIVDGQQRLVSLFLLLDYLSDGKLGFSGFSEQKFSHSQSIERIGENYDFIKAYAKSLAVDKLALKDYILANCTFAVVELDDIDEAFQYFDSQNSRGKPLEAYDLLKAYHLREMTGDDCHKLSLVETWEKGATDKADAPKNPVWLELIISQILYRHRQWEYGQGAMWFTGAKVDVFKGLTKSDQAKYPKLLHRHTADKQMNGVMVDGRWFFEYINHYQQMYTELFGENGLVNNDKITVPNTNKPLFCHLKNNALVNKGDYYVFTIFTIMVMRYYDKFDDYELATAVIKIARWAYFLRFHHQRIDFSSVEKHIWQQGGLYSALNQAIKPEQVLYFDIGKVDKRCDSKNINYLNELLAGFYDDKTQPASGEQS